LRSTYFLITSLRFASEFRAEVRWYAYPSFSRAPWGNRPWLLISSVGISNAQPIRITPEVVSIPILWDKSGAPTPVSRPEASTAFPTGSRVPPLQVSIKASAGIPYRSNTIRCSKRLLQRKVKFAEIFFNQGGKRVFHVVINGTQVLTNFDVASQAGASDTAIDRYFK